MRTLHLLISASLLWAGLNGPAQSAPKPNDDVAIIIGNKAYEDVDIPEVSYAHNDAQAMRRFVEEVLNIRQENIIYLEDATQAKMQSTFGRRGNPRGKAFQFVKPGKSNLYVFYSGHGMPGQYDQKSYLLPVDAEIETAEINGYPTDTLYENLSQIEAKSVTVFLDACFSGTSHGGALIKNASGAQILPATPKTPAKDGDNLTVLSAASKDQLASWDDESQHGLFTEYLLRALYGEADHNNDGQVKLAEVETYLREDMRYKARRTYNRDQMPTVQGNANRVLVTAIDGTFPPRPEIDFAPIAIDVSAEELIPVEQNMFAIKNANVRSRPDVRSKKVTTIPKGEPIHVAAKVADKPWYAIEVGDDIIGYIFQDLLGEEKEIATEEENRSIRELKERLEKLEEHTRLSSKDILPAPPITPEEAKEELVVVSKRTEPDIKNDWNETPDTYGRIEKTMKSMGAILARQNFIYHPEGGESETSFKYNWIRIDAEHCSIRASISLKHQEWRDKRINIHDHHIEASYWNDLRLKKKTLLHRNRSGDVIKETVLYQHGPYSFKDRKDRRLFKKKAVRLKDLCHSFQADKAQPAPRDQNVFRRPPPPPPPLFGRPPPPRRYN